MGQQSYEQLVEHIATLEHEKQGLEQQLRTIEHDTANQRKLSAKRLLQLKTLQTLSLGMFSTLQPKDIYDLTCQTVVHQLQWDAAFIVHFSANRGVITAAYQATQKQLDNLRDYLGDSVQFKEAYAQRVALSTYDSSDTSSLALRALFQTDEVVAMPIQFGDQLDGYLVACHHSQRIQARSHEDLDFLAVLASEIAHAVQNSHNFTSLEEQNKKLRELDELKDSFISITSHQLRTPLSIVKWILSILQSDKVLEPHPEQRKLIDQAYVSNERLIHVVNDLLNVSRIHEGRLPYTPQLTDVKIILRDLCTASQKMAESREVTIEPSIDDPTPLLQLDAILFKEGVQNLIDNAIDYNIPQGYVRVGLSHSEKEVSITIANSGSGISEEEMKKIFQQFYRSPDGMKQQPNGNGLGLFLTKTIIEQHGGTLACESILNKETVFTITLPVEAKES